MISNDFTTWLTQEYSFTLNGLTLLFVLSVFAILLAILGFYAWRTRTQLQVYEKPKYGFPGKPLYSTLVVLVVASSLLLVARNFGQTPTFDVSANRTVTAQIEATVLSSEPETVQAEFQLIPSVDGVQWGGAGDSFDIYWTLTGPVTINKIEFARDKQAPSSSILNVPRGRYTISALVVYAGENYDFAVVKNIN